MSDETIKKNIILLGDGAVGKTSLIRRFVIDQFDDKYLTTIGTKITKKDVYLKNGDGPTHMVLLVWDILGQKGYRYTQALSFGGIEGAILVCDITRKATLESLRDYWMPSLIGVTGPVPMIIIANKGDLADEAEFGEKDIRKLAEENGGLGVDEKCYVTSAKTGKNVDQAFHHLAQMVKEVNARVKAEMPKGNLDRKRIKTLTDAADQIMADFSMQHGGLENATPIIKHQIEEVGVDINNPTRKSLVELVNALAVVEKNFKPPEVVSLNRAKRLYMINLVK
ncbi:MAG: Rab family GTPase [Methanobacteriota archaeon]